MTLKQQYTHSLAFRLTLPDYDDARCAFRWTLEIHCWSDKLPNEKTEGDIVAEQSYNFPINADSLADPAKNGSSGKKLSDSSRYSISLSSKIIPLEIATEGKSQTMITEGTVNLPTFSGKKQIERATLTVKYWPNREIIDGYAEAFTEANLEDAKKSYYTDQSTPISITDNS